MVTYPSRLRKMSSSATPVPACMVHVTQGSMERLINRSRLLSYKVSDLEFSSAHRFSAYDTQTALRTVRTVFKINGNVSDKDILLGVKCTVDRGGTQFLFVSGSSEWSAIAREMKHILVVVQVPGKGTSHLSTGICSV